MRRDEQPLKITTLFSEKVRNQSNWYQIFNNSVPEFVSNLFISVNSRYPPRDIFKHNPCNDIKFNTSIAKS